MLTVMQERLLGILDRSDEPMPAFRVAETLHDGTPTGVVRENLRFLAGREGANVVAIDRPGQQAAYWTIEAARRNGVTIPAREAAPKAEPPPSPKKAAPVALPPPAVKVKPQALRAAKPTPPAAAAEPELRPAPSRPAPRQPQTVCLDVVELLQQAKAEPARNQYGKGSEFMPAVHELKSKGWTMREIAEWLAVRAGSALSTIALSKTYKRWTKERPEGAGA